MIQSAIAAKITTLLSTLLISELSNLVDEAAKGDLQQTEIRLRDIGNNLMTQVTELVLTASAEACATKLRAEAMSKGLRKLTKRPLTFRIFTRREVSVPSLYARETSRNYQGRRHLLAIHWGVHHQASPSYYSQICALSVLCPSFEVTQQMLDIQGFKYDSESVRLLVHRFSKLCKNKQAQLTLLPNETLAGKRVVIASDGGRTRCRQLTGKQNKAGHDTFTTNWTEPKMFVIAVLDEDGKMDKELPPIYGTMFDIEEIYSLLRSYLEALDISKAAQVQIVGDGAIWLWNRTKSLLLDIGVAEDKIVETLDYYHAMQHVSMIW